MEAHPGATAEGKNGAMIDAPSRSRDLLHDLNRIRETGSLALIATTVFTLGATGALRRLYDSFNDEVGGLGQAFELYAPLAIGVMICWLFAGPIGYSIGRVFRVSSERFPGGGDTGFVVGMIWVVLITVLIFVATNYLAVALGFDVPASPERAFYREENLDDRIGNYPGSLISEYAEAYGTGGLIAGVVLGCYLGWAAGVLLPHVSPEAWESRARGVSGFARYLATAIPAIIRGIPGVLRRAVGATVAAARMARRASLAGQVMVSLFLAGCAVSALSDNEGTLGKVGYGLIGAAFISPFLLERKPSVPDPGAPSDPGTES